MSTVQQMLHGGSRLAKSRFAMVSPQNTSIGFASKLDLIGVLRDTNDAPALPLRNHKRGKQTMSEQGRILGIGGIFFKSANQEQMKEWYAKHLGLADSGYGVMLPWREKDNPEKEQMTIWSIFSGDTTYFEPGQASFMVNYIVDDLDALLDRLAKEGVRIDPKRQDESYGRFAWIYDLDGNKIELWQPL
jgi:predicted enzyme related to lactoylglutathione lyase